MQKTTVFYVWIQSFSGLLNSRCKIITFLYRTIYVLRWFLFCRRMFLIDLFPIPQTELLIYYNFIYYSRIASWIQWYIKHTMMTRLNWGTEQSVDMLQRFECQQQWCCALWSQDRETLSTLRGIHCYRWIPYSNDRTRNIFFRSCNTMCYALCHSLHFTHWWLFMYESGAFIIYTYGKIA